MNCNGHFIDWRSHIQCIGALQNKTLFFACASKRSVYNIHSALLLQNVQNRRRHNTINKIKKNQSIALRKIKLKTKTQ